MNKRQVPLVCFLLGFALMVAATLFYPGGTVEDRTVVGFDWSRHYLTNLFRPLALNGETNTARPWAVAGMWMYCAGLAELFRQLAQAMGSTRRGKWVQIFGVATAVYAALSVTRLHDLMINISVGFFAAAQVILMEWLWRRRQLPQFIAGLGHLALLLAACVVYYGEVATVARPHLQKLTFLSSAGWLLWVHHGSHRALAYAAAA
jgi:hypothetical protein